MPCLLNHVPAPAWTRVWLPLVDDEVVAPGPGLSTYRARLEQTRLPRAPWLEWRITG
jgi:hypothetical protein